MPVSLQPIFVLIASISCLIIGVAFWNAKADARRASGMILIGVGGLTGPLIVHFLIGTCLWGAAVCGPPSASFAYSRWLESSPEAMACYSLFPFSFEFQESWKWLDKAAIEGHPEAMYAVGVRVKHDIFVPADAAIRGDGQALIDQAIAKGFSPSIDEELYYFGEYRMRCGCLF